MDFGKAFRYVFLDKAWFKKLIIVALWGLVPVIGVLVLGGWGLKVGKMVMDGHAAGNLPKVAFGQDLRRGFFASLIDFAYALPAVIFFTVTILLARFGFRAEGLIGGLLIILGGLFGLVGLASFVLWFLVGSAAFANFLAENRFGAAFKLRELFRLLRNSLGSWILVVIGQFVAMMVLAPLGTVFFGVGLLFTTAYGAVFWSHLLGQAYLKSTR